LVDFVGKKSSRHRQRSPPSPARRHHHKSQRSRSPNSHRSPSLSPPPPAPPHRGNLDSKESNVQHEATRTLCVENLERDITKDIFGRYGTIEESKSKMIKNDNLLKVYVSFLVDLKKSQSSSKRAHAFIQYENLNMAYEARRAMDGQPIGKADCKIGYGV
jgi:hypothetical protein